MKKILGIAYSMTNKYALLSLQDNEVGHLITLLVGSKFLTSNMHLLDV